MRKRFGLSSDTAPAPGRRRAAFMPVRLVLLAALVAAGRTTPAADLPPALVAEFTRNVQPLLVNKCGAGACHGRPNMKVMPLGRINGGQGVDRRITLANIDSLLEAVGPARSSTRIVSSLGRRHPESAPTRGFVATPLSSRERITLESWLAAVRSLERPAYVDPDVVPASGTDAVRAPGTGRESGTAVPTASAPPNRLRSLLETATNPPVLPPPQEPQGLIFKNDAPPPAP